MLFLFKGFKIKTNHGFTSIPTILALLAAALSLMLPAATRTQEEDNEFP